MVLVASTVFSWKVAAQVRTDPLVMYDRIKAIFLSLLL